MSTSITPFPKSYPLSQTTPIPGASLSFNARFPVVSTTDVVLVGFGFAGKVFHAPVIRAVDGLLLTTIVQRHGPPDPRYPDVEFVRSVDQMLERKIDLIVVATPNTSHHPIAKQCLLAGHHVVVDKPFTTTFAEARELVELARTQRRGRRRRVRRHAVLPACTRRPARLHVAATRRPDLDGSRHQGVVHQIGNGFPRGGAQGGAHA